MYFLCYDITDDKNRLEIATLCKLKGMYRVQYSVFAGNMNEKEKNDLWNAVKPLVDKKDRCCLFSIGEEAFMVMKVCGEKIDKALILGKDNVLSL